MAKKILVQKFKPKKLNPIFFDYWTSKNYFFLILGIIVLTCGYILMSINPWDNFLSLDLSPIILLVSYLVIIPISVLVNKKNQL